MKETVGVAELMEQSGVGFGTSGARGLVSAMSDRVCYCYTRAFLVHLQDLGQLQAGDRVVIGGDLRPSTPRILRAVAAAISDHECEVEFAGYLPSPALALRGLSQGLASITVTGSHIPDDRNGIKFNRLDGEILKPDEQAIRALEVGVESSLFDASGSLVMAPELPGIDPAAHDEYLARFLDFFPETALDGLRIGLYQHSSVARDILAGLLEALGAEVRVLGRSEQFVPVDTEAVRPEDVALAHQWCREERLDALVTTDGDADRPMLADAEGKWLRGDVVGILCARYLGVQGLVTPVSSNSAVELCGWFAEVRRSRIGSPYVIEGMQQLQQHHLRVAGYEANGGFLQATPLERGSRVLAPLPTRDAVIVILSLLHELRLRETTLAGLVDGLPSRFTASDRLKAFPTELSKSRLARFDTGDGTRDRQLLHESFSGLGTVRRVDRTDGLRMEFDSGEILHLRPSGNAPELRCYSEAASEERAWEVNRYGISRLESWRENG